uniref:Receptor expression-enhancing protein n=1 Tax=Eucampia antarctica TaxID=49252 RepID=A0A7S2R1Z6_9STRA|eukprot:CAMPEP_0197833066 /NCGR_PEP_ID=MMETSP1437-20131217/17545_1 /TAXON_ID=49252 ORGANISM="Eucampia antarctica, Strain CCMP1452" /NCGR_SAMPLE_ID=MMETSP1437 /ASSEMBLY_ACC=CAM_ASM_001096 /LENGTH=206 /DNA_ID=CAMNT_0043436853 /DNA_START=28 /DNA_END=648 /DNA_ORIENTATION=+
MDAVKNQMQQMRSKLNQIPALEKAEDTTKIPKEYLVLSGGIVFFILVFFGIGAGSLCSIVGFVYPAFKSLEAIESKIRGDDTQWLIYWVCYSFFSIIEVFVDSLLHWIPFYYAFKLAFLLWAMLPQTKGAKFLYDSFLKEFLKKNESKIDAALNDAKRSATTIASEVAAATAELSAAGLSTAAQYAKRNSSMDEDKGNESEGKKES